MISKDIRRKVLLSIAAASVGTVIWANSAWAESYVNEDIEQGSMLLGAMTMDNATDNTISITGGTIGSGTAIYGAVSYGMPADFGDEEDEWGMFFPPAPATGQVVNNKAIIRNAVLDTKEWDYGTNGITVVGGYIMPNMFGTGFNTADANVAFVKTVNNADIVKGGDGDTASKNIVYYEAKGEGAATQIIGGSATGVAILADESGELKNCTANDNVVIFAAGSAKQVIGGSSSYAANNNTVIITGGNLKGAEEYLGKTNYMPNYVAGGVVTSDGSFGEAINNTVNLAGYLGNVNAEYEGLPQENIYTKGNEVNYSSEAPELKGKVYGGYCVAAGEIEADLKTGNTLNVFGTVKGVENIANFANVNFYIPTTAKTGETLLELSGMPISLTYKEGLKRYVVEKVAEETDLTNIVLNTNTVDMPALQLGESIGLISNPTGIINENIVYKIDNKATDEDMNALIASVKEAGVELDTLGYEVDETSISLKLKDVALTGKYVGQDAKVEQALDLTKAEGYSKIYGAYGAEGASVEINAKLNLPQSTLYGSNVGTNNALNVSSLDNTLKNVVNFNSLNFYIPVEAENGSTMLSLVDSNPVNLANANVKAGVMVGSKLNDGDSIVLLDTVGGIEGENITYGNLTEGIATEYMTEISNDGSKLQAKIGKKIVGENAKSPAETIAANVAMLNAGQDMVAGAGLANAQAVASGRSMAPFAAVGGSNTKYKTGSHVDVKGWNMNLGVAKEIANSAGKLLLAPVVEYGRGNYDSYLDNGLHGSGNSHFWGVGLMAKQTNGNGFYYEGSARAGKMSSDYKMENGANKGANYDTSAVYAAAHLGVGKEIKLSEKNSLDTYAKYFFTHQQGDTVNIKTALGNDQYHFESVNSQRTRLGVRLSHKVSEQSSIYGGLAWQYEFDGEARAVTRSGSTPAPTLKGHSGIAELGVKLEPMNAKYALDLGVTASAGKQKGVGMNVQFNWKF